MRRIALIACAGSKQATPAPALELYTSPLFRKSVAYARLRGSDALFVLSAKHGLLRADELVAPYDCTLGDATAAERKAWAKQVMAQLRQYTSPTGDHYLILAGQRYREHLVPHLRLHEVPMAGLGIGQQLSFLAKALRRA